MRRPIITATVFFLISSTIPIHQPPENPGISADDV